MQRMAVTLPSLSSAYRDLNELHKRFVLRPSYTETRGDVDYEDITPLTRIALCLERTTDARAGFPPGGFGSFRFHRVEWDQVFPL